MMQMVAVETKNLQSYEDYISFFGKKKKKIFEYIHKLDFDSNCR